MKRNFGLYLQGNITDLTPRFVINNNISSEILPPTLSVEEGSEDVRSKFNQNVFNFTPNNTVSHVL